MRMIKEGINPLFILLHHLDMLGILGWAKIRERISVFSFVE
jgi:hypothetical protein